MPFNLKGRSFLTLKDYTPQEIEYLLDLSAELKKAKYIGSEKKILRARTLP